MGYAHQGLESNFQNTEQGAHEILSHRSRSRISVTLATRYYSKDVKVGFLILWKDFARIKFNLTIFLFKSPDKRTNSVLIMALTIIFISCIVLSSMLGRASSMILHRIASVSLVQSHYKPNNWFTARYGVEKLVSDCESGKFTNQIKFVSEVFGVFLVAPLWHWSLAHERPAPFDGTCCLLLSSLVALVLYVCSFSLHLNVVGDFAPHPRNDGCSDLRARKCCSFLCEVVTVSVSDMASLFDEANWSTTPLLGHTQSYSEVHEK